MIEYHKLTKKMRHIPCGLRKGFLKLPLKEQIRLLKKIYWDKFLTDKEWAICVPEAGTKPIPDRKQRKWDMKRKIKSVLHVLGEIYTVECIFEEHNLYTEIIEEVKKEWLEIRKFPHPLLDSEKFWKWLIAQKGNAQNVTEK